ETLLFLIAITLLGLVIALFSRLGATDQKLESLRSDLRELLAHARAPQALQIPVKKAPEPDPPAAPATALTKAMASPDLIPEPEVKVRYAGSAPPPLPGRAALSAGAEVPTGPP